MLGGGGGVGIGGAMIAPRKVVKKKRGKRVGVASGGMGDVVDVPDPEDDEYAVARQGGTTTTNTTTTASTTSDVVASWGNGGGGMAGVVVVDCAPSSSVTCPSTPGNANSVIPSPPDQHPAYVEESPPMRIKAERAMDKAEEFIREKQMRQRTAISIAAERAMQQRGGVGMAAGASSSAAWKTTNDAVPSQMNSSTSSDVPSLMPSNSRDETYQAAKAAAEEKKAAAAEEKKAAAAEKAAAKAAPDAKRRKT